MERQACTSLTLTGELLRPEMRSEPADRPGETTDELARCPGRWASLRGGAILSRGSLMTRSPDTAALGEPGLDLIEGRQIQRIDPALAHPAHPNQASRTQDLEMLRDGGPGEDEALGDLASSQVLAREQFDDFAPSWIG
jgi:hypothetical protein